MSDISRRMRRWLGWGVMVFAPSMSLIMVFLTGFGLMNALVVWLLVAIVSIVLYNLLTRHPLLQLIYGKGILMLTLDSSGVIQPIIAQTDGVKVSGKVGNRFIDDLFDRTAVHYLKKPIDGIIKKLNLNINTLESNVSEFDKKDYDILLKHLKNEKLNYHVLKTNSTDDMTALSFGFDTWPCLIYNKSIDTFLTKDALATLEAEGIIRHTILYLKRKAEELSSIMRDFARTVVEHSYTKGKQPIYKNLWFWLLVGAGLIVLLIVFWPQINQALGGFMSGSGKGLSALVNVK